jgi:3-carboxy-cis,cis-muconate cycloisomerase
MGQTDRVLLEPFFTSSRMCQAFSDRGRLQAMLDVEAALARAEASVGVIPTSVVLPIVECCRVEGFDIPALAEACLLAGNPAIPLVLALTARVAEKDPEAMRFVHWGATSQDIMDSGLVLQLRNVLSQIEADLASLSDVLAGLARRHKSTLIAGRTWMQQAMPTTFGVKVAGWLSANERHRQRLAELRPRLLVLQFGGAVGTLSSLGGRGLAVAAALADDLGLALPDLPWHTERDRLVELTAVLGLVVGSLGKIARDVSLLMQSEIGELFEPMAFGRGGSSAMPHKRNPVGSASVLAAAIRLPGLISTMFSAMTQEQERGLGNWHAEWETLPEICLLTGGAIEQITAIVAGIEVDSEKMRSNLDITQGLIFSATIAMALAPHLGKRPAHLLVEQASHQAFAEKRHLKDVLSNNSSVRAYLSEADLAALFDPTQACGLAETFVDRVLAACRPTY